MNALLFAAALVSRPTEFCAGVCPPAGAPYEIVGTYNGLDKAMAICIRHGRWFNKATGKMVQDGQMISGSGVYVWAYPSRWRDCYAVEKKWLADADERYNAAAEAMTAQDRSDRDFVSREAHK